MKRPNNYYGRCKTLMALSLSLVLLSGCQGGNPVREDVAGTANATIEQSSVDRMVQLAETMNRKGDTSSAIGMYHRALQVLPNDLSALLGLGKMYLAANQPENAERLLRHALDQYPGNAKIVLPYAQSLLRRGQATSVIALLDGEFARPQSHPFEMYSLYGLAKDRLGQHQQAEQAYRQGLVVNPRSFSIRNNLAYCLMLQGQYEQARDLLQQMVEEKGGHSRHRQNLALAYGLSGESAKAESISRLDLALEDVRSNLAYYQWLRELPMPIRYQALMGSVQ